LNATDTAGVATVDLGGNFGQLAGAGQVLAVAQIVFTVTELAGIHAVAFTLDGQAIAVPAANGAQVDTPVTRSQYASLAPD
jgi:spore germination protein GerM